MTQLSTEDQELIAGYVLGDLSPEEMTQMEQRLAQEEALQAELHAMQVSLWLTPQSLDILPPPPLLRDKIMAANAAAPLATPIAAPSTAPVQGQTPIAPSTPIEPVLRSPTIPWGKIIAGLAGLAAVLLGADNLRLRQALSFAQQSENDRIAAILQRPNSRLVTLKGDANPAAGTLLFTPGKWEEVVVSLGNLPPLPPDQIYRMWLTLANGETLPCGEFKTNPEGSVFVKLNPPKTPPKGVKATGIYVTVDGVNAPLNPKGDRVMSGSI